MPSVAYGLVVNNNDNDNNNITENKIRLWSISNPQKGFVSFEKRNEGNRTD